MSSPSTLPQGAPDSLRVPLSRREFLQTSTLVSGAWLLGLQTRARAASNSSAKLQSWSPGLYLRIDRDGITTIISKNPEAGQGIKTTLPMVVAECLNVDWESVHVEQAPLDERYGRQLVAASGSTPDGWDDLRIAGTTAATMLCSAAAGKWGVPAAECEAEQGFILHRASKQKEAFGELIDLAAIQPVPRVEDLTLKSRDFKLLGRFVPGVDNPAIVTGKSLFGCDVRLEGMHYAVFVKCPSFGGRVRSANLDEVRRQPAVTDVFVVEGGRDFTGLLSGVAIVAKSWWAANQARKILHVDWASDNRADSQDYAAEAQRLRSEPGQVRRHDGDVERALKNAYRSIESSYRYPFVAHATMEPQNCTAHYRADGSLEFWAPSQDPKKGRDLVAETFGISPEKITVNLTRIGGGFGRRLRSDFMVEVAAIAQRVPHPVQLQWTREDDIQHDFYRPAAWHDFRGGVDRDGRLVAWDHHFITFGKGNRVVPGAFFRPDYYPAGLTPNYRLRQTMIECDVPTGPWRAPGHSAHCWAFQSFFDELAALTAMDPLNFRLQLLEKTYGTGEPPLDLARTRATLKAAAAKAGWDRRHEEGRNLGIAFHYDHGGYMTYLAEVTGDKSGAVSVDKVYAGVDVGPILNRSGADNQIHGCIMDSLSAAQSEITFANGATQQSNFHDYPILRGAQAPEVDITYLQGTDRPAGLGELIAAVTPAITNAMHAATGIRARELPLRKSGIHVR